MKHPRLYELGHSLIWLAAFLFCLAAWYFGSLALVDATERIAGWLS